MNNIKLTITNDNQIDTKSILLTLLVIQLFIYFNHFTCLLYARFIYIAPRYKTRPMRSEEARKIKLRYIDDKKNADRIASAKKNCKKTS